jgi:hypothetical protein
LINPKKGSTVGIRGVSRARVRKRVSSDYDLLKLAKQLVQLIPINIAGEWVKGLYTGKNWRCEHDLNEMADSLAVEHMESQQGNSKPLDAPHHTLVTK